MPERLPGSLSRGELLGRAGRDSDKEMKETMRSGHNDPRPLNTELYARCVARETFYVSLCSPQQTKRKSRKNAEKERKLVLRDFRFSISCIEVWSAFVIRGEEKIKKTV